MPKNRLKKRYRFSLMEILVAMGLISILLAFLLRFYTQIITIDAKITESKNAIFEKEFFYTHLQNKFLQLLPATEKESLPLYTSKNKKLHLCFHNGVDLDPAFSGPINAKIYSNKKDLILEIFALDDKEKNKQILLYKNIRKVSFQFFNQETGLWEKSWDKKRSFLPPLCRLILHSSHQEKKNFTFSLPSKCDIVFYSGTQ